MGGDHKCPLCSATFTRPQHVGRHLRAHTGDRPYECKECPLRFARSDLLSRHVNKAHRPPGEDDKKDGRKGRRKSSVSSVTAGQNIDGTLTDTEGVGVKGMKKLDKARAASFSQFEQSRPNMSGLDPGAGGFVHPAQSSAQTALPAHALYPHHPLLANSPRSSVGQVGNQPPPPSQQQQPQWNIQPGVNGYIPQTSQAEFAFSNPFAPVPGVSMNMANPYASLGMSSPFTATPMRYTGSEHGVSSTMGRNGSGFTTGIDYGNKKRACDQCNHSKVRCDFNDPCARCTTKNLGCSYNKPPKSRSIVQAMPWAAQRLSMPNIQSGGGSHSSLSPSTQYSSPGSQSNISPVQATASVGLPQAPFQPERGRSFGAIPQFYPPARPDLPIESYSQSFPALQGWNGGIGETSGSGGFVDYSTMSVDPLHDPQMAMNQSGMPYASSPQATLALLHQQQQALVHQHQLQQQQLQQSHLPQPLLQHSVNMTQTHTSPNTVMQPSPTVPSAPQRQISNPASTRTDKSNGSPPTHLANTPSLTSHTTSPSESDEPPERRTSSFSSAAPRMPEPVIREVNTTPNLALALSPTSLQPAEASVYPDSSLSSASKSWQSVAPSFSTVQMTDESIRDRAIRNSISMSTFTDDDDAGPSLSQTASLAQSMINDDESLINHHRRRSSVNGAWANAFNAMSLQDQQHYLGSSLVDVPDGMKNPFAASQMAQTLHGQQQLPIRPGYPMFGQDMISGMGEERMPSMSDVKDLWKQFMSEPMPGYTPVGEKTNALAEGTTFGQAQGHIQSQIQQGTEGQGLTTSRPTMGNRTLSKSNSVPDLTSPFLGQAFFATYLNTMTPKQEAPGGLPYTIPTGADGMDGQIPNIDTDGTVVDPSMPPEIAAAAGVTDAPGASGTGLGDIEQQKAMHKWKKEIQSRQTSFSFQPPLSGKFGIGRGMATPHTAIMYPGTTSSALNGGLTFDLAGRPSASVLQPLHQASGMRRNVGMNIAMPGGSVALNQTLAPERVPSFNVTPGLGGMGGMGTPRDASGGNGSNGVNGGFVRPRDPSKLSASVAIAGTGTGTGTGTGMKGQYQHQQHHQHQHQQQGQEKGSSATTRPGNKRLASQTLVGEGKKATFGFFDEDEGEGEGEGGEEYV